MKGPPTGSKVSRAPLPPVISLTRGYVILFIGDNHMVGAELKQLRFLGRGAG